MQGGKEACGESGIKMHTHKHTRGLCACVCACVMSERPRRSVCLCAAADRRKDKRPKRLRERKELRQPGRSSFLSGVAEFRTSVTADDALLAKVA